MAFRKGQFNKAAADSAGCANNQKLHMRALPGLVQFLGEMFKEHPFYSNAANQFQPEFGGVL